MTSTLLPVRAIAAALANRIFLPIALTSAGLSIFLIAGTFWLSTLSQWWLLLLIPILMAVCIAIGVLTIIKLTLITIRPAQTQSQKNAVKSYVDLLLHLSEITQTPRVVLLFRAVRDASAPSKDGFIGTLTRETVALKKDFELLQKMF
jgi:heme/copper-type cytochrome/quinol oxidase subunit 2